ncbi:MAG: BlaI/MecI/CopY family transcriptional regulator [Terriglobales bacterium]
MTSRSGGELPQLELDCLAQIWTAGEASVADVHRSLAGHGRQLAYTTVLTVLDRLRRKQVIERRRHGRAYLYRSLVNREQMRAHALARLVRNYFDSPDELQSYLRGGSVPTLAAAAAPPAPSLPDPQLEAEPAFLD